jgi:hypothetical protein
MNLATPKAAAKHELLFNNQASDYFLNKSSYLTALVVNKL